VDTEAEDHPTTVPIKIRRLVWMVVYTAPVVHRIKEPLATEQNTIDYFGEFLFSVYYEISSVSSNGWKRDASRKEPFLAKRQLQEQKK